MIQAIQPIIPAALNPTFGAIKHRPRKRGKKHKIHAE
jgi:hypothetical protein